MTNDKESGNRKSVAGFFSRAGVFFVKIKMWIEHSDSQNRIIFWKNILTKNCYFFTAYIVCVYEDPIVPEQAASVTEKLGDYLIQVGF